jgi:hypothetical protein
MQFFTIRPDSWFAWQMFPGYGGLPYCSPIYVTGFRALKAGRGLFRMQFINVFYAEGVQAMDKEMRVLSRQESYLVAALIDDPDKEPDRCVVISHIGFEWIQNFCPNLWQNRPPSDELQNRMDGVATYLNQNFFSGRPLCS